MLLNWMVTKTWHFVDNIQSGVWGSIEQMNSLINQAQNGHDLHQWFFRLSRARAVSGIFICAGRREKDIRVLDKQLLIIRDTTTFTLFFYGTPNHNTQSENPTHKIQTDKTNEKQIEHLIPAQQ